MNMMENLTDFKLKLKNFMRPDPKGFRSLFELDKQLRAQRVDLLDPFTQMVKQF